MTQHAEDIWLIFLAGLFGSLHCVGMCGAIVLAYSTQVDKRTNPPVRRWILRNYPLYLTYNGGRILSDTVIGGMIGAVGGSSNRSRLSGSGFRLPPVPS